MELETSRQQMSKSVFVTFCVKNNWQQNRSSWWHRFGKSRLAGSVSCHIEKCCTCVGSIYIYGNMHLQIYYLLSTVDVFVAREMSCDGIYTFQLRWSMVMQLRFTDHLSNFQSKWISSQYLLILFLFLPQNRLALELACVNCVYFFFKWHMVRGNSPRRTTTCK